MKISKEAIPFGLLFEEPARVSETLILPTYDASTDLSYVNTADGQQVPFVELNRFSQGTATITEVRQEITDTDPEDDRTTRSYLETADQNYKRIDLEAAICQQTETITKKRPETTDRD